MKDSEINLGGFPPILYITTDTKKKREYEKKATEKVNNSTYKHLNILKITDFKNLLGDTSKK